MLDNPQIIVFILLSLAIAIPVHEFAHARSAVSYGDDSPRRDGRLTISPLDHFEPVGAFMCVITAIFGFGLGWGKPVMVNPANFRSPHWDMVKCAAWGPFSNLLMAVGVGLLLRFLLQSGVSVDPALLQLLFIFVLINLGLMLFNLIPIYPLDGSKILLGFLPNDLAFRYDRFMSAYGILILLGLVFFGRELGVLNFLILEPREVLLRLILGG